MSQVVQQCFLLQASAFPVENIHILNQGLVVLIFFVEKKKKKKKGTSNAPGIPFARKKRLCFC